MGVVGVFIPYIICLLILKASKTTRGMLIGAFLGALLGDVLAAVFAGLELGLSILSFPYSIPIAVTAMATHHFFIGVGEGIITAIIVSALMKARPELLELPRVAPTWMENFPRVFTTQGGLEK